MISAQLREATLEEALQKLLIGNDFTIVKSRLPRNNPRSGSRLVMLFVLPRDGGRKSKDHPGLAPRFTVEGNTPEAPIANLKDHANDADPAMVQELAEDLLVSNDPREREAGVELLADLHSPEVGHLFRQALGQDPDAFVRERAAKALGDSWDPQHVDALTEALVKDPDVDVRRSAALAMGEIGAPEAISALQRALDDLNPEVRGSAVQALGDFADSEATSLLRGALSDPDPEVRKSAAYQLKRR